MAERREVALKMIGLFVRTENNPGAGQPATTARKGDEVQDLAAVVSVTKEDRDGATPVLLRDMFHRGFYEKHLVPQSLDPACERPDARPAGGIRNVLTSKQIKGVESRTAPWHVQILGGGEVDASTG
jgi:hypothetical protein